MILSMGVMTTVEGVLQDLSIPAGILAIIMQMMGTGMA
jgi:hypothetical protein